MQRFVLLVSMVALSISAQAKSLCEVSGPLDRITCPSRELEISGSDFKRAVRYATPAGKAPKEGWPAVIIYQGSFFDVEFSRQKVLPFGGYNEIRLIQSLLDSGFAVVAPRAIAGVAWMTNIIGVDYEKSQDFDFIQQLLKDMKAKRFGKLNMQRLYATGISSGGYHSSRMAVSFPGVFKALAIESASFADCKGPLCFVPDVIPQNHPPTLFLHGEDDRVVPVETMLSYYEKLKRRGVEAEYFVDPTAGHQWLDDSPELITEWFLRHP
ncbi:prolyl oligopeptidase family serine peptidase [Bdellovibrio sp. 22V]|uniref:extracellular medium-chain-length polyhydroxyalkanoate depolymerase n=1 Tax=Bdellovibrio sp. 22V TaxID=3044166 RepID=UPI002543A8D2|nr:prolyl oligopeptidase family serine peptidase [Bdellovibrio sp. 22V]WII72641.1 prolyl oligopeptidase family serine peptidase [Bdellovibrio sp. 22V]